MAEVADVEPSVVPRAEVVREDSSLHEIELRVLAARVLRQNGVGVEFRVRGIHEDSFHPVQLFESEQARPVVDEDDFQVYLMRTTPAKGTFHFCGVRVDYQGILKEVKRASPPEVFGGRVLHVGSGSFLESSQVEEGRHDCDVSVVT